MNFVSVIIVNWNGEALLRECLESLRRQTYRHFEVILVDNASTDGSVEFIQQQFPEAKLIRLEQNRGFAGGNIEGLRVAKGDYIALLNNDAVVEASWLAELVAVMNADSRVGICASKLVNYFDPEQIDCAGDGCATSGHGYKRGNGLAAGLYQTQEYVFGACAGAVLYRRAMIDDIGFLDPDFFIQCEDTDLNFRAKLMEWKCVYVPTAVALHRVSTTIGKLDGLAVYYSARNEEYVWIKNMPAPLMLRYLHHKIIQELAALLYFCLKRGQWGPFLRGKRDAARALPALWRKRAGIQRRKRVANAALARELTPLFERRLVQDKLGKLLATSQPGSRRRMRRRSSAGGSDAEAPRVVINGIPLLGPRSGVGSYVFHTCRAVMQLRPEWQYRYFYGLRWSPELWRHTAAPYASARRFVRQSRAFYPLSRRFTDLSFRLGCRREHFDLYHETNFTPMPFDGPTVVTVHDLSFLRYPEKHPPERVRYLERYFRERITRASHFVTGSEASKREMIALMGLTSDQVTVTPLGVAAQFRQLPAPLVQHGLRHHGLEFKRYLLYVGTLEPRKNIPELLEAYAQLSDGLRARYPLVLAGARGWLMEQFDRKLKRLGIASNVRKLGYVPEEDLVALYNGAVLFVYPSLYEGFGLPPLESMACGTPVIASNVSSVPEVVGAAGLLIPPGDPQRLKEAILRLLSDEAAHNAMRQAGLARARRFSWERCAHMTLAVYDRVTGRSAQPADAGQSTR